MKYEIFKTRLFRKQYRKVMRYGMIPDETMAVVDQLSAGIVLDGRYRVHRLKGEYAGLYELHIRPDFLLVYSVQEDPPALKLVAIGSHSQIFG